MFAVIFETVNVCLLVEKYSTLGNNDLQFCVPFNYSISVILDIRKCGN